MKILDFGIAKLSGSLVTTQTGVIKGKLGYMPAEQITGDKVDRRTDVFAAGVLIWEAVTGTCIWANVSEATIMNRVLNAEIPRPSSVSPDVPSELERICMKALEYDAANRYSIWYSLTNSVARRSSTERALRTSIVSYSESRAESPSRASKIADLELCRFLEDRRGGIADHHGRP